MVPDGGRAEWLVKSSETILHKSESWMARNSRVILGKSYLSVTISFFYKMNSSTLWDSGKAKRVNRCKTLKTDSIWHIVNNINYYQLYYY